MGEQIELDSFDRIPLTEGGSDIAYLLVVRGEQGVFPFYVGETGRGVGRLGDYLSAQFSACTDFVVGTAIQWLRDAGFEVEFLFRSTAPGEAARKQEERRLIELASERVGGVLLNDTAKYPRYDYRRADRDQERARVEAFCEEFCSRTGLRPSAE